MNDQQEQLQNQMKQFMNLMSGNKEYYITVTSVGQCRVPPRDSDGEWTFLDWKLSQRDEVIILWTRVNNKI